MDTDEEQELGPGKFVFNQFSARGQDLAQVIFGCLLTHPQNAAIGYYRSRPFVLSLVLDIEDAVAARMPKSRGYSDGRDTSVVCNYLNLKRDGAMLFTICVGAQYTAISGCVQQILGGLKYLHHQQ